jgi:NAD(P)-dependent dehydrogenase (short-subunit alcohol dehydrogenase family)
MILNLIGKKVVVVGGRNSVGGAIAKAVADEGADVVIWLRKWSDEIDEAKALPITQLEVPSQPNGTSLHTSLWRETMAHRSYW